MVRKMGKRRVKYLMIPLIVSMFVGCGASSMDNAYVEESMKQEVAMDEEALTNENALIDEVTGDVGGESITINTESTLNRKIIKKGHLSVESKTFNESVQMLMDEVDAIGGFMQDCSIEGDQELERGYRRAELTVRIPKDKFDGFMNNTSKYGNVTSKQITGEDVTDQYFDVETRMTTLEIRQERLQEMLKQSGSLEDLFAIENELSEVIYEIELLKVTLNQYDSLIDFATVDIVVNERYEYKEKEVIPVTFVEKMVNQLQESCKWVVEIIQGVVLLLISAAPFIVVFWLPIALIVWIIIRVKKRRKAKQANK